jgi:glutamate N-acetyltransferase/amino-acid N-acetyltransferase
MYRTSLVQNLEGGITAVRGVKASGVRCGIKSRGKDLALIYTEAAALYACVYTKNALKSASLLFNRGQNSPYLRAIIVNSGCANTCTGKRGVADAREIATSLAQILNVPTSSVLIASTGRIGEFLPTEKIKRKLPFLVRSLSKEDRSAASAILTTDKRIKRAALQLYMDGDSVRIGAIAKGAGMIHPQLGTMLAFVATDAALDKETLDTCLKDCVNISFNRIIVDGDTSPNDFVVFFANGLSGKKIEGRWRSLFFSASKTLFEKLATMIVEDAEGATKLVELRISEARTKDEAKKAAMHILTSPLVKSSLYGAAPNWGRIMAKLGTVVRIKEERVKIYINGCCIVNEGVSTGMEEEARKLLLQQKIKIHISLGRGRASYTVMGCDISPRYVRMNALW